jgi:sugar transferase EpsL
VTSRGRSRERRLKRWLDLALAVPLLVLTSPLMLVASIAIRSRLGRPVLFRQMRPGLHGRLFEVAKFRTMLDALDADGRPLPDEERLTRLGRLLRRTSIDELPQLWNVVVGDMSIVGPRPLLTEYLPLYTDELARRHDVPPGITGWAAVSGRRSLSLGERLALDVWYVDNWSLALDLRIILRTVALVLTGRDAEPDVHRPPDLDWARPAQEAGGSPPPDTETMG